MLQQVQSEQGRRGTRGVVAHNLKPTLIRGTRGQWQRHLSPLTPNCDLIFPYCLFFIMLTLLIIVVGD